MLKISLVKEDLNQQLSSLLEREISNIIVPFLVVHPMRF